MSGIVDQQSSDTSNLDQKISSSKQDTQQQETNTDLPQQELHGISSPLQEQGTPNQTQQQGSKTDINQQELPNTSASHQQGSPSQDTQQQGTKTDITQQQLHDIEHDVITDGSARIFERKFQKSDAERVERNITGLLGILVTIESGDYFIHDTQNGEIVITKGPVTSEWTELERMRVDGKKTVRKLMKVVRPKEKYNFLNLKNFGDIGESIAMASAAKYYLESFGARVKELEEKRVKQLQYEMLLNQIHKNPELIEYFKQRPQEFLLKELKTNPQFKELRDLLAR